MIISDKNINLVINFILSTIIAGVYLAMHNTGYYSSEMRTISAIGLIPVICSGLILLQTREIRIAVVTLVLYQTWNMFLEPYVWKVPVDSIYRTFNEADFPNMAIASAMSIYALFGGCIIGMNTINSESLFEPNYLEHDQLEKILAFMMVAGYIIGLGQGVIGLLDIPLGFFGLIETMLPSTVGALMLLYILRGGRNYIVILLTGIYMIYYFVYYVGGTLFIYSIFLVFAPTIAYIIERAKIPYFALTIIIIILMPIYLSRHAYRNEGLYSTGAARMSIGMNILKQEYSNISIEHLREMVEEEQEDKNVDNRLEGVSYLGHIVQRTQLGQNRFLYGETIIWLPTMFIPHFLIPFRPGQNMGDQWAIYYGIKDSSWEASMNFPMLCEFYVNFGFLGMIILSFFNGLLIVWFMRKFNDGIGDTNILLLIFVVTKIVIVEANVTMAYGAILQVIAVCWFYKRFFIRA